MTSTENTNVVDMLERVVDKDLADFADAVAKMYEPIERVYSTSVIQPPVSLLAASANRRNPAQ